MIFIPVIIAINLIVWFLLFSRQNRWTKPVLINTLISPFILTYFFNSAIERHVNNNYKTLYFSRDKMNYKLMLELKDGRYEDDLEFNFYEIQKGSSSTIDLDGKYIFKKDTVFLTTTKGKQMKVSKTVLLDYPTLGDKTILNASRD